MMAPAFLKPGAVVRHGRRHVRVHRHLDTITRGAREALVIAIEDLESGWCAIAYSDELAPAVSA